MLPLLKIKFKYHLPLVLGAILSLILAGLVIYKLKDISQKQFFEYESQSRKLSEDLNQSFADISSKGYKLTEQETSQLVYEKLQVQAKFVSTQISNIIRIVENDLLSLKSKAPSNRLLKEIYERSKQMASIDGEPFYKEISFIDRSGKEIHKYSVITKGLKNVSKRQNTYLGAETYFRKAKPLKGKEILHSRQVGRYTPFIFKGGSKIKYSHRLIKPSESAFAGKDNPYGVKHSGIIRFVIASKGGFYTLALNSAYIKDIADKYNPESPTQSRMIPDGSRGSYAFIQDRRGATVSHPRNELIMGVEKGRFVEPWSAVLEDGVLKPNKAQLKSGRIPTDCRFLKFAGHCQTWLDIYSQKKSKTIEITWAGMSMYSTVYPIFLSTQEGPYRDFGYVVLNYNKASIADFIESVTSPYKKLTSSGMTFLGKLESLSRTKTGTLFNKINKIYFSFMVLLLLVLSISILLWFYKRNEFYLANETLKRKQFEINAKQEISRQVAHDIKSPLAALTMIIKEVESFPEGKRDIIQSATERIHSIAESLLRGDVGHEEVHERVLKETHLSQTIEKMVQEKRLQFGERDNLTIETSLLSDEKGPKVSISATEFNRVLSNILNNAIESTDQKLVVKIDQRVKGGQLELAISDNGPGIPQEILERVAEKGFTEGKKKGSGLGLYHAKESIESWGGSLSLSSELGKGTIVTISFPLKS